MAALVARGQLFFSFISSCFCSVLNRIFDNLESFQGIAKRICARLAREPEESLKNREKESQEYTKVIKERNS